MSGIRQKVRAEATGSTEAWPALKADKTSVAEVIRDFLKPLIE